MLHSCEHVLVLHSFIGLGTSNVLVCLLFNIFFFLFSRAVIFRVLFICDKSYHIYILLGKNSHYMDESESNRTAHKVERSTNEYRNTKRCRRASILTLIHTQTNICVSFSNTTSSLSCCYVPFNRIEVFQLSSVLSVVA